MSAIEVAGLTKDYGDVLANDDVTFDVESGEIFGYLGPNGAGKTTTIRTLMGLQSPTDGTATVLGADIRSESELVAAKQRIGYLPANPAFDETATGEEVLDLHASLKGDQRREELLELFDPPLERPIRDYSTGNVQKLGLVQAFMHDPDLVVMDEPTSGLDPLLQRRFNEFVRSERDRGTTVFLSSHVLSEVRQICDRVGIIRGGRIVTVESVADLLGRSGKSVTLRVAGHVERDAVDLPGAHDLVVERVDVPDDDGRVTEVSFTYTGDVNELADIIAGFDLLEFGVEEAPLEDVFMRFYGDEEGTA
ncbi:ABC-2 type transport system ATP-binding protein [Natronoarchaeum philippinense]|uniref:ABC-2 type transport system ATP-binding protein n=1 Tax=Natronoarchaeum philippinense TaxID=558529 RepID=A0A285NTW6_NATPI|nr:ABC transporter ATP-binding protein [Natronoarchaeum philippinense]SNZ12895.1 ABC-2 type transport system ATP-binding protein [Natronoarchaeum philippinense]